VTAPAGELEDIPEGFLREVVAALLQAGRSFTVDLEAETLDVDRRDDPAGAPVLGVVRPVARGVTFYAVHPRAVPAQRFDAAVELAVRATNDQFDTTVELDPASASVSVRASVTVEGVDLSADVLGTLLDGALERVEETAARYRTGIDAVLDGTATPAQVCADVRASAIEDLERVVRDLDGA